MKQFHEKLLDLMKQHATEFPHDYINPHFLSEINNLLYEYYDVDDSTLNEYINEMWES